MISSGVRQVVWASLGVVSQGVGRLATNVVVGRVGGPAVLGSMATVLAVAQILVTMWPGSLGSAGVKFVAQARGRGDEAAAAAVRAHLALRSLQGCTLLGIGGGLGWLLWGGGWRDAVATAVVVLALGTSGLVQGLIYAERRTRTSSVREAGAAVVGVVGVAVVLAIEPRTPGAWLAMPLAVGLLLYAVAGWPRVRPRSLGRRGRELDLFTLTSALGSVSSQGFIQLSVVAAASAGRDAAGQFAVALALCTPLTLVVTPLGLALFPAVNEAVGRGDSGAVRRQITVATHFLAYALLAGGGLLVLLREPLVTGVWGADFAHAADIFVPLVAASSIVAVALPATNGMTSVAQRHASRATAWSIGAAAVGAVSWVVLVPAYGAVGVAVGLLVGRAIYAIAVLGSVRRLHGLDPWLGLGVRVAVVVAAAAALDAWSGALPWRVAVFAVVGLGVLASDATMRTFLREQVPWPTRR